MAKNSTNHVVYTQFDAMRDELKSIYYSNALLTHHSSGSADLGGSQETTSLPADVNREVHAKAQTRKKLLNHAV